MARRTRGVSPWQTNREMGVLAPLSVPSVAANVLQAGVPKSG